MITKLQSFKLIDKFFIRGHLNSYLSSLSGANRIRTVPKDDQNPSNSSQFEENIQSLKDNPHPQTLIKVLSSTNDLNSSLKLFKWASLQNQFYHTTDTYYHIIMKLGVASRVDEMEGFCNEMVKYAFAASEQALLSLIDSFISYNKIDEALRVFFVLNSVGHKPPIVLINRLLGVLVEGKKGIKSVLFVYKEMVKASIFPNVETLNYILEALFDTGRVDSAMDQYKRIRKKGCCPNSRTYEIMVSGLICNNLLDEAIVVLDEILDNNCDLESKFFSNVLPLLFKMNKHDIGLRLFEKMRTCSIVPDLLVYEVLIRYYTKNVHLGEAINLFNAMISRDLKPPDSVYVDVVNGFCILNKLSEAKQFLEDQQVTDANSYNVLLESYCQVSNYVDVIRLFQKMVEKNIINSISWNILIRFLVDNQTNDIVYKAFGKMIVSGLIPDSKTYSALILGNCKSNKVDDAVDLFHQVVEENWVVDSSCYAALIESLCKMDKILEAVDVFRYMSFNKCTLHACSFSMLIRRLCLIGKVDKVVNLLPLAYNTGLFCSSEDYVIIMKGVSQLTKGNGVLVIIAKMVIQGCYIDSGVYNELVKTMSEHHRVTECAFFLNRMVNEGWLPNTEVLSISFSFLARKFKLHMVLPAIQNLCSVSGHEVLNRAICSILINGLWKEGYKYEARWLLDMMLEKGWVPDATTHRLLVNSGASETSSYENDDVKDEITCILSEGFREL
ncbi:uncharacterized protein [Rutidosis leptorrhynchoides]|uniref:uncharacterized protein n=1 Tax=Rutidosis leptorrhynchoides TaxID=125765 RepID=UPI003A9A6314